LSKCKLDVSHPKFHSISGSGPAFDAGIKELQGKVARDHRLSNFVSQPMPGYPQYEKKVWKWDFEPAGNKSYTRKGWRLYAYVPDPNAQEPILAQAFLAYDKADQPTGNPATYVADALKEFLSSTKAIEARPDKFRRMLGPNGQTVSMCNDCFETILSPDQAEADIAESGHEQNCPIESE
jgi:hypothetical protein